MSELPENHRPNSPGRKNLSKTQVEAAHCDAQIHEPGQRNKATIPPRIRREVLTRDLHQCRRKGCHDLWHERGGDLRAMLTDVLLRESVA